MAIQINFIKQLAQKGITITDLANEVGITRPNMSNIINGKTSGIQYDILDKICKRLECQVGDLLEYKALEQDKKTIIPMFLDYTGTTDLLIDGGVENVERFFHSIIEIQEKSGCEIRSIMATGSSLKSAKGKLKLLSELAGNYGLPNLFDSAIAEYCGFLLHNDGTSEVLLPIDPRIVEHRKVIEGIIGETDGEISNSIISYCNVVFDEISQIELSKIAEEIENKFRTITRTDEIETVIYYDYAGKECDIKPKEHTKSKAVLMILDKLQKKYNIPLTIIGGDSKEEDLMMYMETKDILQQKGIKTVFIAPSNIGEIETVDKNIIVADWENSDGIAQAIKTLANRITIKEDGGIDL